MKLLNLIGAIILSSFTFFSCSNEKEINGPNQENRVLLNFEDNGFLVTVKSDSTKLPTKSESLQNEQFIVTVAKDNISLDALILKENISSTSYNIHHYDTNQQLIATLLIRDGKMVDILLNENTPQTKGYFDCVGKEYKRYKNFYSQGDVYEVICDVTNVFLGVCTVSGALQAGVRCLF